MANFTGWFVEDGKLYRPSGKVCSQHPNLSTGYLMVRNKQRFLQHRVIFFLAYGYWPDLVDHKDRDKLNNYPDNLRDATQSEQHHNKPLYKTNTSGTKGVRDVGKGSKPWKAQFALEGKLRTKQFATKEEAVAQRLQWEELL